MTLAYTTEQNGQAPEAVNITVPTTNKLIINLPESTVTLNGTSYTAVEATTAGNTLIVPRGRYRRKTERGERQCGDLRYGYGNYIRERSRYCYDLCYRRCRYAEKKRSS